MVTIDGYDRFCKVAEKSSLALRVTVAEKCGFGSAFGWRSGSPFLFLLLGGAAVHRCDNC